MFSFTPADKEPITAVTFKETRFGSHTPRIDHEFLNRLRQGAARKALLTPSPHPNAMTINAIRMYFARIRIVKCNFGKLLNLVSYLFLTYLFTISND